MQRACRSFFHGVGDDQQGSVRNLDSRSVHLKRLCYPLRVLGAEGIHPQTPANADAATNIIQGRASHTLPARRLTGLFDLPHDLDATYRLVSIIGEGAMGIVYRGVDKALERTVAIKVIRTGVHPGLEADRRFLREARTIARIENEHVVDVLFFGQTTDGLVYLVMEYVDGRTLNDILANEGPLSAPMAVAIGQQVCDALAAAHKIGVLHRDLKPSNIMVAPQPDNSLRVKVVDFGVAKTMGQQDVSITSTGAVLGSFPYLAPEQIEGHDTGPSADIYALGCVLYEMLSGRRVFDGDSPATLCYKHVHQPPIPLRDRTGRKDIPAALDAVVRHCLAKKPRDRYATMEEVGAALHASIQPAPAPEIARTPTSQLHFVPRTHAKVPWWIVAALVSTVAALGYWAFVTGPRPAATPPTQPPQAPMFDATAAPPPPAPPPLQMTESTESRKNIPTKRTRKVSATTAPQAAPTTASPTVTAAPAPAPAPVSTAPAIPPPRRPPPKPPPTD